MPDESDTNTLPPHTGPDATFIRPAIVFVNVFLIATCGLIYELLAATLASYVLGDSVTQFSLVIGIYLSALGVGSWLSKFVTSNLGRVFIEVELVVALLGGTAAPVLFLAFARVGSFSLLLYTLVFAIGVFVGLEIPLLMRLLENRLTFKDIVARVLAFDYVGSLAASILFPIILVPRLGLIRTSLLFGLLNAAVALWSTWLLDPLIKRGLTGLRIRAILLIALLCVGFWKANALTSLSEEGLYADDVVYATSTPYQRIVVTKGKSGFQLFLNGNLQFASADEYRYHEALVHPAMLVQPNPRRVLVLGGGDGLALREILKWPAVEAITLVDLDPGMTDLSKRFPPLADLNSHSFEDGRVTVINQDAMIWLQENRQSFDVTIVDFPDPNSFALGKLYTTRFYALLRARLAPGAIVSVQCTSPLFARSSYWCIVRTLEASGFVVRPYQTAVPSFGVWGFVLARLEPFDAPTEAPSGLRFLNREALLAMFRFSADMTPVDVEINRLDNQALVRYYEQEWKRWD